MKKYLFFLASLIFSLRSEANVGTHHSLRKSKLLNPFYYDNSGGFDPERLIFGGGVGMNFYDQKGYDLYISPVIGYQFGRRLQMGVNLYYSYTKRQIPFEDFGSYAYNESNYGGSIFMRLFFLRYLFLTAEPELLAYKVPTIYYSQNLITGQKMITNVEYNRELIPAFNVGGGLAIPIGERASFLLYCLYDLVQNPSSPTNGHPIIRGGFNVAGFSN